MDTLPAKGEGRPVPRLPMLRYAVVGRPALLERLLAASAFPVVLLAADPGFGKTTLMCLAHDALAARGRLVDWLDARHAPDWLDRLAALLAGPPPRGRDGVVFIDHLDQIAQPVADRFDLMLAGAGSGWSVIAAATGRAPFRAADMVVQERLKCFGTEELRMSPVEAEALFAAVGATLLPEEATRLCRLAEGWPVGLKLMAQDRLGTGPRCGERQPRQPVPGLAAYFEERAFRRLPGGLREALLAASITEAFNARLFEQITGSAQLPDLEAEVPFLRAVADRPGWRRFHGLYRQFLQERSASLGVAALSRAHHAAARWFLDRGRLADAAEHALEAGEMSFATDTIDKAARSYIANGMISAALSWIDLLGPTVELRHPRIKLFRATALTTSGRFEEADGERAQIVALAHDATVPIDQALRQELLRQTDFQAAMQHFFLAPAEMDFARLDAILEACRGMETSVFGETLLLKVLTACRRGEVDLARSLFPQVHRRLTQTASWYALVLSEVARADLDLRAGRLEAARDIAMEILAIVLDRVEREVPVLAIIRIKLAEIALEENDLDAAAGLLALAFEQLPELQSGEWEARALLLRAHLCLARQEFRAARVAIAQARECQPRHNLASLDAELAALDVRTLFEMGREAEAVALLEGQPEVSRLILARPSDTALARIRLSLAQCEVLAARGKHEVALARLSSIAASARQLGLLRMEIEALVLAARVSFRGDDPKRALRSLREAENLAQASGMIRPFVEFEQSAADSGLLDAYAGASGRRDGAAARPPASPARRGRQKPEVVEADIGITGKELEVLELVAAGYSNQQIADELFAALSTVKWHVRNILAKLDVQNRAAAISRARSLRLIR